MVSFQWRKTLTKTSGSEVIHDGDYFLSSLISDDFSETIRSFPTTIRKKRKMYRYLNSEAELFSQMKEFTSTVRLHSWLYNVKIAVRFIGQIMLRIPSTNVFKPKFICFRFKRFISSASLLFMYGRFLLGI